MSTEYIRNYFVRHNQVIDLVARELAADLDRACRMITDALAADGKVLVMGNGGSAADAQHLAAEFVGRFLRERKALPAIALTTDSSILTAIGNDYGFDEIFKRQVEALARPGDIVIGISTSGRSNNVFQALTAANQKGCQTIALLGKDGGNIADIVNQALVVAVPETPHIQESHLSIIHILCDLVERQLFCGRKDDE